MISIPISHRTPEQEQFFNLTVRNQCFSGGFGNGKTYVACQKAVYLLSTFPRYRMAIARFEESKLKQSTMQTFFKPSVCPPELYDPQRGGNRADSLNHLRLINGSEVLWMNLKDTDEGMVRGLEVNSVLVDQAEEISEKMYLLLSGRVGRWDLAEVPRELLERYKNWPTAQNTGRPKIPNYMMVLCNPDSELHWLYKRFHPESEKYQEKYSRNHKMIQGESTTATLDPELLQEMMDNDTAWTDRFVKGKWGIPGGQIHQVRDESILRVGKRDDDPEGKDFKGQYITSEYLKNIIERGNLTRVLDHGDASPTSCLWFSAYKGWYFCYREYYKPNTLISEHRRNITELSGWVGNTIGERFSRSLIDPQCAKKTLQKYGGTWTHIDEYLDKNIDAPPIAWEPADNNEFATRNRISELLRSSDRILHPITGQKGAPQLYFIQRSNQYPQGCYHAISELKAQKRKKVDTVDGKDIFSDDRADGVSDHAYDCIRYFCASHLFSPRDSKPKAPENSFYAFRKLAIRHGEMERRNRMYA